MILKESGSHFDPRLVQAFTDVEEQFVTIQEQLADDNPASGDTGETKSCLQECRSAK
jgi:HD-GYP domain-containing protein (c-di-GMP phosphodiesterase class II)